MALHDTLLEGFEVKSRPNGSVHTLKNGEGRVVAEICVGARKTRVNFREPVKAAKGVELTGKSKNWAGGGVILDDSNVAKVRAMPASLAAPADKPAPRKQTRSSRRVAAAA